VIDFGALPPEVNSGRMYVGPGSGPMLAAAAAWDDLAAELQSMAASYGSTVEGLTVGPWTGPSSIAMAAAATPYVSWISATGTQAEQAAAQAKVAAAAYETAFAATVPPPVIVANRALLTALIATNILGQNTPAIAATEAQYAEMWAQDAAAMYAYAGSSAAASQLVPFVEPPRTTTDSGGPMQAAAVSQSGTSSGLNVGTQLSQLTSAVPNALQSLASGIAGNAAVPTSGLTLPSTLPSALTNWNTIWAVFTGVSSPQSWTLPRRPVPVVRAGIRLGSERAGRRRLSGRPQSDLRGVGAADQRRPQADAELRRRRRAGVGVDGQGRAGRKHVGAAGLDRGRAGDQDTRLDVPQCGGRAHRLADPRGRRLRPDGPVEPGRTRHGGRSDVFRSWFRGDRLAGRRHRGRGGDGHHHRDSGLGGLSAMTDTSATDSSATGQGV